MSPAKKKIAATRKPKAPPAPPPKPELPPSHRRFFAVVNRKNAIGLWLISLGSAFCLGYILTDKAHLHEKVVLWVGGIMIVFGAHFLSSEPTERALLAIGKVAKGALPFGKKEGEQ